MDAGYFLDSGALSGAENMAIDAALLKVAAAEQRVILRLYRWSRPTLSLGYFQKLDEVADPGFVAARAVEVVRRPTGGGAILHDDEMTFSLAMPAGHSALACSVDESYLALTRPLLELIRMRGIDAKFRGEATVPLKGINCFSGSACPDVVVGGDKVFGSAQRRRDNAVLMHGSLILGIDWPLWRGVFGQRLGQGFASLPQLSGLDWAAEMQKAYGNALGLSWEGIPSALLQAV
ncbi:MAG: lipoate--protein ligase family protein [candidate division FCPU426 bacterium]